MTQIYYGTKELTIKTAWLGSQHAVSSLFEYFSKNYYLSESIQEKDIFPRVNQKGSPSKSIPSFTPTTTWEIWQASELHENHPHAFMSLPLGVKNGFNAHLHLVAYYGNLQNLHPILIDSFFKSLDQINLVVDQNQQSIESYEELRKNMSALTLIKDVPQILIGFSNDDPKKISNEELALYNQDLKIPIFFLNANQGSGFQEWTQYCIEEALYKI